MFDRSQIIQMTSKHKADCKCAQCGHLYNCSIYDAARSKIGHLCKACKSQISGLKTFTQNDLNKVFRYDAVTGLLTYANDSDSGKAGDVAGYPHSEGYLSVTIGRKEYLVHRVIWFMVKGYWPLQIDHQNHRRDENHWTNLIELFESKSNQRNLSINRKNNTSGVMGVRRLPSGKYSAFITVNRKQIGLGTYPTLDEARVARKAAERRYGFHVNHGT